MQLLNLAIASWGRLLVKMQKTSQRIKAFTAPQQVIATKSLDAVFSLDPDQEAIC